MLHPRGRSSNLTSLPVGISLGPALGSSVVLLDQLLPSGSDAIRTVDPMSHASMRGTHSESRQRATLSIDNADNASSRQILCLLVILHGISLAALSCRHSKDMLCVQLHNIRPVIPGVTSHPKESDEFVLFVNGGKKGYILYTVIFRFL